MRQEFSKKTKAKAFLRAEGKCEECGVKLTAATRIEYDHRIPCALGGGNTVENCCVACGNCHGAKTAKKDIPAIAKAKRLEASRMGAAEKKGPPIPGSRRSKWKRKINGRMELRHHD